MKPDYFARWMGSRLRLVPLAILVAPTAPANVVFNLIPESGTPQFAIDGFNAAAGMWSSVLANNITINIQIGYASLAPNVIGETSSTFVEYSYSQTVSALGSQRTSVADHSAYANLQPGSSYTRLINHTSNNPNGANSATPYLDTMDRVGMTTANAKALGLLAPGSSLDATIRFSSNFSFDFNHAGPINPGQMDFVGVAAHEIGHALGFVSGVDDIDYFDGLYSGDVFSSNMLDLFRYSPLSLSMGVGVTDYTADNRGKYFSVDGGTTEVAAFATGVSFGDGTQASHWKDNLGIGLLDPTAAFGERLNLTDNDLLAMDAMGYNLVPEPGTTAILGLGFLLMFLHGKRG
ncbi:MAG: PEP-CTERM sorting domain-containing protein [Akkermansiaceae bacterium]|nr:PEP-CTERM sorting domain-containing protein [Verrucomicrobiales bacterium]